MCLPLPRLLYGLKPLTEKFWLGPLRIGQMKPPLTSSIWLPLCWVSQSLFYLWIGSCYVAQAALKLTILLSASWVGFCATPPSKSATYYRPPALHCYSPLPCSISSFSFSLQSLQLLITVRLADVVSLCVCLPLLEWKPHKAGTLAGFAHWLYLMYLCISCMKYMVSSKSVT
jgi:hypothetical protein